MFHSVEFYFPSSFSAPEFFLSKSVWPLSIRLYVVKKFNIFRTNECPAIKLTKIVPLGDLKNCIILKPLEIQDGCPSL